jgi:hypothetical protein
MLEDIEHLIQQKASLCRGGVEFLSLEAAKEIIELCQISDLAVIGIDTFLNQREGVIIATELIFDYSPPREPHLKLPWQEFKEMVNTNALQFLDFLQEKQKSGDSLLVELVLIECYEK